MAYKICPVCGTKNEPNALLCKNCSYDISSVAISEEKPIQTPLVLVSQDFSITIIKPTVLGREGIAKSHFTDKGISRKHAKIFNENGQWYIQDLNSTNGTYLNGQKLIPNKKYPLQQNDILSLAQKIFFTVQFNPQSDTTVKEHFISDKTEKEAILDDKTINKTVAVAKPHALTQAPKQVAGYDILKHLSSGGESDTYLVQKEGQHYVLKIYRLHMLPDLNLVKNIKQLTLEHPQHLVRLIDYGETEGNFYEIYEYCKLGSIAELLQKDEYKKRFSQKETFFDFLQQVNEALKVLHSHNIYHRDLKPSNILLRDWFEVVLCDFGIAKSIEESTVFTKNFKGTYKYSAPETFSNEYNKKSDYWSLGMILYLLYFGKEPFEEEDLNRILSKIVSDEPIAIETDDAKIKTVLQGLLQKDSTKRWGATEIDQFLQKEQLVENKCLQESEHPQKYRGWEAFDDKSAQIWREVGFTPQEALEWKNSGFMEREALLLKQDANLTPQEAKIARLEGLSFDEIKLLKKHFYALLQRKKAHNGALKSLSYDPEGIILASGGNDYAVRLWNSRSYQELAILEWHTDYVQCVSFDQQGKTLASASKDKTICLWNVETKKHLATLQGHQSYVTCVSFHPSKNILASGSWDMQIRVWDIETQKTIATLNDSKSYINSIDFNHDGSLLACGTEGGEVIIWQMQTKEAKAFFNDHTASVHAVAFHPNKNILASGSEDGYVILWDYRNGEKISLFRHGFSIKAIAFHPDGTLLATAGENSIITIWDTETGVRITQFSDTLEDSEFMEIAPMQEDVLAVRQGNTIEIWNLHEQTRISTIVLNAYDIVSLAYHPKGDHLCAGTVDGKLHIWSSNLIDTIDQIKKEGFSVKEFLSWLKNGFSLYEAKMWYQLGFDALQAQSWRTEGFLPYEAKKWIEYGFDVQSAMQWKNAGFLPNIAKNMTDDGFSINELFTWLDNGFGLEEAKEWKRAGFDIEEAKLWKEKNIPASKAKRFRRFGLTLGSLLAKIF
ncbi:protein kinase domain-containing protein [Nitratiruptor sp. SB155-2]|uniref:protein kinase domain-containing protein n=1 Tax=Nitratiruptor sp. (strain SB155-2) TaxID=387092 RepID=UPI0001586D0E|nr:protein kinase [Nitratiruptor sp. SB155-2]BAF69307.1 hypothetical protein NIS_0193 [Nitratiruptor sp. SB155-2]